VDDDDADSDCRTWLLQHLPNEKEIYMHFGLEIPCAGEYSI